MRTICESNVPSHLHGQRASASCRCRSSFRPTEPSRLPYARDPVRQLTSTRRRGSLLRRRGRRRESSRRAEPAIDRLPAHPRGDIDRNRPTRPCAPSSAPAAGAHESGPTSERALSSSTCPNRTAGAGPATIFAKRVGRSATNRVRTSIRLTRYPLHVTNYSHYSSRGSQFWRGSCSSASCFSAPHHHAMENANARSRDHR
jgi:hypothetical protein